MKQHIETITHLLLGAAYADKRLEGAEVTRIRSLLSTLVDGEVSERLDAVIRDFSPAAFKMQDAVAALGELAPEERRTLLELVASVNDADDELAEEEDKYLRKLATALGLKEEEYDDLTLEILEDDELRGMLA